MRVGKVTEIIEVSDRHNHDGNFLPTLERVTPGHPFFERWLDMRQSFMEARGWTSGFDGDQYDMDPQTIQLLNIDGQTIEAGLRLTPQKQIEDTMSWSWLPENLQDEARLHLPTTPHGIWDLTRLVPGNARPDHATMSLVELFGAGYELSSQKDADPRWIFATTESFFNYFRLQGIEFTPIVTGKFSADDTFNSVLCYADPADKTNHLQYASKERHQKTYAAVRRGIAAVSLREAMDR